MKVRIKISKILLITLFINFGNILHAMHGSDSYVDTQKVNQQVANQSLQAPRYQFTDASQPNYIKSNFNVGALQSAPKFDVDNLSVDSSQSDLQSSSQGVSNSAGGFSMPVMNDGQMIDSVMKSVQLKPQSAQVTNDQNGAGSLNLATSSQALPSQPMMPNMLFSGFNRPANRPFGLSMSAKKGSAISFVPDRSSVVSQPVDSGQSVSNVSDVAIVRSSQDALESKSIVAQQSDKSSAVSLVDMNGKVNSTNSDINPIIEPVADPVNIQPNLFFSTVNRPFNQRFTPRKPVNKGSVIILKNGEEEKINEPTVNQDQSSGPKLHEIPAVISAEVAISTGLEAKSLTELKEALVPLDEQLQLLDVNNSESQNQIKILTADIANHAKVMLPRIESQLVEDQKNLTTDPALAPKIKQGLGDVKKYYEKIVKNMTPDQLQEVLSVRSKIAENLKMQMDPIEHQLAPLNEKITELTVQRKAIEVEVTQLKKAVKTDPSQQDLLTQKQAQSNDMLAVINGIKAEKAPLDTQLQPFKDQADLVAIKIKVLQDEIATRAGQSVVVSGGLLGEIEGGAKLTTAKVEVKKKDPFAMAQLKDSLTQAILSPEDMSKLKLSQVKALLIAGKGVLGDDAVIGTLRTNVEANIPLLQARRLELESQQVSKGSNTDVNQSTSTTPTLRKSSARQSEVNATQEVAPQEVSYVFKTPIEQISAQRKVQIAAEDVVRSQVESNVAAQFASQLPVLREQFKQENVEYANQLDEASFNNLVDQHVQVEKDSMLEQAFKDHATDITQAGKDAVAQFQLKVAEALKNQAPLDNQVVKVNKGPKVSAEESLAKSRAVKVDKISIEQVIEDSFVQNDQAAWEKKYKFLNPKATAKDMKIAEVKFINQMKVDGYKEYKSSGYSVETFTANLKVKGMKPLTDEQVQSKVTTLQVSLKGTSKQLVLQSNQSKQKDQFTVQVKRVLKGMDIPEQSSLFGQLVAELTVNPKDQIASWSDVKTVSRNYNADDVTQLKFNEVKFNSWLTSTVQRVNEKLNPEVKTAQQAGRFQAQSKAIAQQGAVISQELSAVNNGDQSVAQSNVTVDTGLQNAPLSDFRSSQQLNVGPGQQLSQQSFLAAA